MTQSSSGQKTKRKTPQRSNNIGGDDDDDDDDSVLTPKVNPIDRLNTVAVVNQNRSYHFGAHDMRNLDSDITWKPEVPAAPKQTVSYLPSTIRSSVGKKMLPQVYIYDEM